MRYEESVTSNYNFELYRPHVLLHVVTRPNTTHSVIATWWSHVFIL